MAIVVEVCVDSLEGARIAEQCGADRLELCANLPIGGTTPSAGLLRAVLAAVKIPVNVLIRPRAGDFVYSADEIVVMLVDIAAAHEMGAAGIVSGALTVEGMVDVASMEKLLQAARGLPFTFHRAFDVCAEPFKALEVLQTLGVQRLLTSGQAASVQGGIALLKELMAVSGDIILMPGGGITPLNIHEILDPLPISEIHFSGAVREEIPPMAVNMGKENVPAIRLRTDADTIQKIMLAVRAHSQQR